MEQLWPLGVQRDDRGELWIGGCAASELARAHGTPLYVFDEATLRNRSRTYLSVLRRAYPAAATAAYASKAYLNLAIGRLFAEEGLDLDVVSGGELYVALRAGFPANRIHFHGNNKSRQELAEALSAGIGRIVVDNFHELEMLSELAHAARVPIWLRLSPGVQAHTHAHIQTGHEDTKFGFSIASGDAERAVAQALRAPGLALVGLHAHIGSQIYETDALAAAAARLVVFAAAMRDRHGLRVAELSPGGGWGVPMTGTDPLAAVEPYVTTVAEAVVAACRAHGLDLPHLVLEPGRSLVAQAGVAIYRAGARKEIPGVRTYISVDGGMADNIRPALYGASYTAEVVPEPRGETAPGGQPGEREVVTLAGRFCESGDVLIRDIELPRLEPGDLVVIPMAGAYTLSMASNYNLTPRPAVILVSSGQARLIQRRESYADLTARDLPLAPGAAASPGSQGPAPHLQDAVRQPQGRARFTKYHALGNDYLVLDTSDWPEPPAAALVRRLCDRHRGIGADGLLWGPTPPQRQRQEGAEDESRHGLRLFNPDGGEFEKSGNGLRIFARYLWDRRLVRGPDFSIETPAGPVRAHVLDAAGSRIAMAMGRLSFDSRAIPAAGPAREVLEERVDVEGRELWVTGVGIGNPHCVVFLDGRNAAALDGQARPTPDLACAIGPLLEHSPLFPQRTNVQFVQALDAHTLAVEVWERGAGYTFSSGTSSCAAAAAAIRTGRCASPVTVVMPGGAMLVEVADDWTVRLTGTAEFVCWGEASAAGDA